MKLVAHLVKADLRRSWLPLAGWMLLAMVTAIIPCLVPSLAGDDRRLLYSLEVPIALITVAYPTVLLVLVVQIVQTDPLVGSTAFWMTRAIPPRTLLASKLVLLGVATVLVPMVIEIVRMIAHGVPWSTQIGVALWTAILHSFLVSVLCLGAVLTASLSRFLLLAGAVLVSLAVLIATLLVMGSRFESPPSYAGWSAIPDPTPEVVQWLVFVLAMGLALVTQYQTRSSMRTVGVAAAGIAASIAAAALWPWPLLMPMEISPPDSAAALRVVANANAVESFSWSGLNQAGWIGVRGPLRVEGVEPRYSARVGIAQASLVLGNTTLTSLRDLYPVTISVADEEYSATVSVPRAALGVDRMIARTRQQTELPTLFFADAAEMRQYATSAGHYRGRVRIVLQQHDIEAAMPLSIGSIHHRGAYRLVIDGIDARFGAVSVRVHESRAGSVFDRTVHPLYSYYLRNERTLEAVPGSAIPLAEARSAWGNFSLSRETAEGDSGFTARELSLEFTPDGGDGASLGDAWLADAQLVIVATRRARTIERDLEIANFPLSLPTRAGF